MKSRDDRGLSGYALILGLLKKLEKADHPGAAAFTDFPHGIPAHPFDPTERPE